MHHLETRADPRRARLELARRRARARRDSAGAALFIVAITLGLLAVMGIYGLSSTAADIRAAGHMREALQAQHAGEHALMTTAETFNPSSAKGLVEMMTAGVGRQNTDCKTAAPWTGNQTTRAAEACLRLNEESMRQIALKVNPWNTAPLFTPPGATPGSFGQVAIKPFIKIEVTNPVDVPPPPGSGLTSGARFTQVTTTVFVEMRKDALSKAESVVVGRGRLTVGPITGQVANY